jgi:hypothetical protein
MGVDLGDGDGVGVVSRWAPRLILVLEPLVTARRRDGCWGVPVCCGATARSTGADHVVVATSGGGSRSQNIC